MQDFAAELALAGLQECVTKVKVAIDDASVLVVYLDPAVLWHELLGEEVAHLMKWFCISDWVRVGWSDVAHSEVLGLL